MKKLDHSQSGDFKVFGSGRNGRGYSISKRIGKLARIIFLGSLLAFTWFIQGCAHHAYKPQRIEVWRHTLVLHETRVQMENAYEQAWAGRKNKRNKRERGEYTGFYDSLKNDLHCYVPWPESCILHEYKHHAVKEGLEVPDDPHFK